MALTLQQLKTRTLDILRETSSDSHFSDNNFSQLVTYLNDAQDYLALLASPPEDLISVAITPNVGRYNLASDHIVITSAYFGTTSTSDDVKPLTVVNKNLMRDLNPGWLDQTSAASGVPSRIFQYDNSTFYVDPKPNADQAGKRIYVFYGFDPTDMSADSDVPSIKSPFHFLLPRLAASMAYYALSNPVMGKEMKNLFRADFNDVKDIVDREADENFAFKWAKE